MMVKNEIYGIFPTPVYVSEIDRKLTDNELNFVFENKKYFCKNDSNIVTENKYILNETIFSNLKKEINLKISDYFSKIICTSNNIEPYITQSWITYTEKNQYHAKHHHPNSIVSGVLYIDCDEKLDKIIFFKDRYETIKLEIEKQNLWNSDRCIFYVKPGDIILFPSHLKHMVETTQSDKTRISLAFNVFIRGQIGKNEFSSELILV